MTFFAALRKEIFEQWRTYRLLICAVVLGFFGMTSPLLAKFTPEILKAVPGADAYAGLVPTPTVVDAYAQYIKNMAQFGLLLALLITMGAVAVEKEKGTAAMMLVKPLPRQSFLLAKFAVLAVSFSGAIALAGLAAWYYTWLLFGPLDLLPWLGLNALILAYVLVHVAVTLFFSVVARSAAAAGGMAFGVLMVLAILGAIPVVGEWLPSRLPGWGAALAIGHSAPAWPALAVSVGIAVVALAGAVAVFERQEL